MNISKIGQLIAVRRAELGLTQTELAQRLHVTDKAVSKWERGKSLPDITIMNRLAAELKISVVELLNGEIRSVSRSSNIHAAPESFTPQNFAQPLSLNLNPTGDILVSPSLFGCNLEHTRSSIHTGLSAQMLRNRKFVGKPSACRGCPAEWFAIGEYAHFAFTDQYTLIPPYTRHSENYHMKRSHECNALNIMNPISGQDSGIGQHSLSIQQGETYVFAVVVKTTVPLTLSVSLTSHNGTTVYASGELSINAPDWERFELKLTPDTSDCDADISICFSERGSICLGAVSLMPDDNFRGMRKDVIAAMKELGVTILRWPGGNFAGEYSWMDGLLPVDMRAPFESYLGIETQPHSMGYDNHEINTDDFVALCREIGAQPFITINPCWNTPEENAAWVEYCNGDASTTYGRLRAERGFEKPYNVQLWSLGNEFGYGHMEGDNSPGGYCQLALENGRKMLEVSPYLSLCSSGPYPNKDWAELSARPLYPTAELVSLHYYGYQPIYLNESILEQQYYSCLSSVKYMQENLLALRSTLDNHIKISYDEWNVWYAWYRPSSVTDGLYNALAMHMLIGEAEKSGIALACHFEAINEGMIRVSPHGASLTAQGQIFSLMKHHAGGVLLHHSYDAVATANADGLVTATIINASLDSCKEIDFSTCGTCIEASLYTSDSVLPPSRFSVVDVLDDAQNGKFTMPPHSVMCICFNQK